MANNELIGHLTGNGSISGGTLTRKGDTGRGISSIIEKYAVSTSNTTSPTTWYNNPSDAVMTSTNKYLWNYEIVTYTDNTSEETAKRIIGIYGDKGSTGDTGNGITSTTITYGVSSSPSTMPSSWSSSIPTTISDGDYLWTKITINYTDTSMQDTVIYTYAKQGEKGDTGSAGTSVTVSSIKYQEGTSATTAPTGTWSDSVVAVADGNYLWTKITFSDGNIAYGVAKQGEQGATYDDTEVRGLIQGNTDDIEDIQEEQIVQNERIDALESLVPQGTATGESITINDSARYKFKNIVVGGNTKQDTSKITYTCAGTETGTYYFTYNSINYQFTMPTVTEGDILVFDTEKLVLSLNNTAITTTTGTSGTLLSFITSPNTDYPQEIVSVGSNVNFLDKDSGFRKGYIDAQGVFQADNQNALFDDIPVKENQNYIVTFNTTVRNCNVAFYNKNKQFISRGSPTTNLKKFAFQTPANTAYITYYFSYQENVTMTQEIIDSLDVQLKEGTQVTGYSKYGCGSVDFLVRNKNLADVTLFTDGYSIGTNGLPTSSAGRIATVNPINVKMFNKIKVSYSVTGGSDPRYIYSTLKEDGTLVNREAGNASIKTIDTSNADYLYLCIYDGVNITKSMVNYIQVEQGEQIKEFIPHQEQTITVPLPEGMEFCKIGNYKDYPHRVGNKWYKHKEIDKMKLVSTLNWFYSSSSLRYYFVIPDMNMDNSDMNIVPPVKCTHFFASKQNTSIPFNAITVINDSSKGWAFKPENISSMEDWKQFITDNDVYVYWAYKTPVEEEITDTDFIEQAEAMLNMYSYKGITHIDSDNEPSPVFEVVYFKDFETILNNIEARLSLLE